MKLLVGAVKMFSVMCFAITLNHSIVYSQTELFDGMKQRFMQPPAGGGTVTLWWLNGKLSKGEIRQQMLAMRDQCGFSGVAPLTLTWPDYKTQPEYLTEEYYEMYGYILDTAKDLGMKVVFYDDCNFPSGTAGGSMKTLYPNDVAKYLERLEIMVQGPAAVEMHLPQGTIMSVVAANLDTRQSKVITNELKPADINVSLPDSRGKTESKTDKNDGRTFTWEAPQGNWRLQAFVCTAEKRSRYTDYLDPNAVNNFVKLTYDEFYKRFPGHFGSTAKVTFFDDLGYHLVQNSQMWTPEFNKKYTAEYGESPELLYPALWEDVGPDTESARSRLYGFRDQLFAEGYPKVIQQWCESKGMISSGHPAASYRPNPIQCPGDAILFYKYQGYPLTDYIHGHHHGVHGFTIPASAAYNWDKPILICEIYGNFNQKLPNNGDMMYRAGMEAYARGINYLLPHGTWLDEKKVKIGPEISWRNPNMADALPGFNTWAARCETLLQGGRHVADIGVVYPIRDLQARYNFKDYKKTNGREVPYGSDYYQLLEMLTCKVRQDYTLLHPEVIDEKCSVDGREIVLNNRVNWERYKVLILPSCRTVMLSNLRKIKQFYDNGGIVIATTCLPEKSVESGRDKEVEQIVYQMFGKHKRGIFIQELQLPALLAALKNTNIAWDITIENVSEIPDASRPGNKDPESDKIDFAFNYIHKVKNDADIYFLSNSTARAVSADITIASNQTPQLWNPHTGQMDSQVFRKDRNTITINVRLDPVQSRFVVLKKEWR